MSGRKQHNIPQVLLRGFRCLGSKGKEAQVFVFSRGRSPFLTATHGVAAQRHFYSELASDGADTLDDIITNYEARITELVASIRAADSGTKIDPTDAAELVTHLTVRNAHIRQSFGSGVKHLVEGLAQILGSEANARRILGVDAATPSARFLEVLKEAIQELPLPNSRIPAAVVENILYTLARENFSRAYEQLSPVLSHGFKKMVSEVDTIARKGHNKALSTNVAPPARVSELSALEWTTVSVAQGVVLPDCVALGRESGATEFHPLVLAMSSQIQLVIMPVSTSTVLIGLRSGTVVPDLTHFNTAAAECSHTFFVSSEDLPVLRNLVERIGTRASRIIEEGVSGALSEITKPQAIADRIVLPKSGSITATEGEVQVADGVDRPNKSSSGFSHSKLPSCSVKFLRIEDQEVAKAMATAISEVVFQVHEIVRLDRLAEIIVAVSERDEPNHTQSLETSTAETEILPATVQEGIAKCRIVMSFRMAKNILEAQEEAGGHATYILARTLAHIGFMQLLDEALPGAIFDRIEDEFDSTLHHCASSAWTLYFSARVSAPFKLNASIQLRHATINALNHATQAIQSDRAKFQFDHDLDTLFCATLAELAAVLASAGALLGHCDASGESPLDTEGNLFLALEGLGLIPWMDFFRNDLRDLWHRRGQWVSVGEFMFLNRHVERLLWQFKMVSWKTENQKIWVEVLP